MNNKANFINYMLEAEKTLEYTLLLPQILPIKNQTEENWVETSLFFTYRNCHKSFFDDFNYNFFGDPTEIVKPFNKPSFYSHIQSNSSHDVHCENYNYDNTRFNNILNSDPLSWPILSQCVLAGYDTAIQHLGDTSIKPDKLASIADTGITELLQDNLINPDTFIPRRNSIKKSSLSPESIRNKLITFKFLDNNPLFQNYIIKEPVTYEENKPTFFPRLSYADVIHNILNTNNKTFLCFCNLYNNCPTQRMATKLNNIYNVLYPHHSDKSESFKQSLQTDSLYYYYKVEKMFSLHLSYYIMTSISDLKKQEYYYPDGYNELSTIASIGKLPNVFSRNIFLTIALESLQYKNCISNANFFKRPEKTKAFSYISIPDFTTYQWSSVFDIFCRLFGDLIFPAEEWYFFITLYKTISYSLFHTTNFDLPDQDITSIFKKMQEILSIYITNNATQISEPEKLFFKSTEKSVSNFYDFDFDFLHRPNEPTIFDNISTQPIFKYLPVILSKLKDNSLKYNINPIQLISKKTLLRYSGSKETDANNIRRIYIDYTVDR